MTYTARILTPTLGPTSETLQISALRGGIAVGAVGTLIIETPPTKSPRAWRTDTPVLLYRNVDGALYPVGQTVWFLRSVVQQFSGPSVVQTLTFHSANDLLRRRIVAYQAGSSDAGTSASAAGAAMVRVVSKNLGASAIAARDISTYLTVVDSTDGATISLQFARRNVLGVLAEMADASSEAGSPLFFDVTWLSNGLVFRVYPTVRGKNWASFGKFAPIDGAWLSFDWEAEENYIYAGGQGEEELREVVEVSSARSTVSPFNRCEAWYDRRDVSDTTSLTDAANAYLQQRLPKARIGGTVTEGPDFRYGRDWDIGDRFLISAHGYTAEADVMEIRFSWSSGNEMMIAALEGEVET